MDRLILNMRLSQLLNHNQYHIIKLKKMNHHTTHFQTRKLNCLSKRGKIVSDVLLKHRFSLALFLVSVLKSYLIFDASLYYQLKKINHQQEG